MARGIKKTIQEKIEQKEELIEALTTRLKKEKDELQELQENQKLEELNELRSIVEKSGLDIGQIITYAQSQNASEIRA